ncbi:MAG: DUF3078 domain-containing protein [Williamsia sp.]|nr:DUF3078 domain-containing protein [Williamsia sp.]
MKQLIFFLMGMLLCLAARTQDATVKELKEAASKQIKKDAADTIPARWKKGGLITFNLAQGALSNWQGGGDKSTFSVVSYLNLYAYYKKDRHSWDNTLDLGYGVINTTSLGTRKSDDRIDLVSKYGYTLHKKLSMAGLFNFRSQFSPGFEYEAKNASGAQPRTKTSTFLAPAYVLLSLGFNYKPADFVSVFVSPITQRWVIVQDNFLSSKGAYGVDTGKKSRNELGAFLSADFNKEIAKNVVYKSRLDLFSNYKSKPQNVDVYWTNVFALKVNRFLSANITLDLLYDDDAIARWQLRQLLGVGFSAKF